MSRVRLSACRAARSAVLALAALALGGCGGSSGGAGPQPPPQTALVVGNPSGAIYQELASSYQVTQGDGTESDAGYDILIYDGNTVPAGGIDTLPATNNFLLDGKILIVLSPTQADRMALEDHLGAAGLVTDSPAVAVFNAYSSDELLQNSYMVEFPETLAEDSIQSVPPGPLSQGNSTPSKPAATDAATLRAQTQQWRTSYENSYAQARKAFAAISGISPAQFAAAAANDGSVSPAVDASSGNSDLSTWLTPPAAITAARGSQFLTVQPFQETRSYTLPLQSIYYQDRFQSIFPKAVVAQNVDGRGLCAFLPINASFALQPPATTYTNVNISIQTYRILEQNSGVYSHEIIAHQYLSSVPTVTPASPASPVIGTENVSFCHAAFVVKPNFTGWECTQNGTGCNAFSQGYPVSSLRGFNEQFVGNFTWDSATAPRLTLDSWVPKAQVDQATVSSSQAYNKTVSWSVQGGLCGGICDSKDNVGVSLGGNYGSTEQWTWSQQTTMNLSSWQMVSPGPIDIAFPARSIFDFHAYISPDSLSNLQATAIPPATPQSPQLSFSVGSPNGINNLQAQGLTDRNESDWSTRIKGGLLPASPVTLNITNAFTYGEVYSLYTLAPGLPAGLQPYGALHTFTAPTIPVQLDFAKAILQRPLDATWTVSAVLNRATVNGFFPVVGTVTLNQASNVDTTLYLGAQLQSVNNGGYTPTPSVIEKLPFKLVIPAGQISATFNTFAQQVGSPYNVQWYAFQAQGQQAGYPMTIPAS